MDISQLSSAPQVPYPPAVGMQAAPATAGVPVSSVPAPIQAPVKPAANAADLKIAVDALNKLLKPVARNIEFSIDESSGKTLIQVVDTDTNTVIRQTPSKEVLAIAREIDRIQGLLIRAKA